MYCREIKRRIKYKYNTTVTKPPPPHNINPFKGSIYITASREFIKFLMEDTRSQDFLDWIKDTMHPDETFFSSINSNNHLKAPGSYTGNRNAGKTGYYLKVDLLITGFWVLSNLS